MFTKRHIAGAAMVAASVSFVGVAAYAGGSFQTLPVIGGSSYCASTVTGTGGLGGTTGQGQGTVGSICGQTVPAGPTVFSGAEVAPFDLYAPGTSTSNGGPQTALVNITQLGQGPMLDVTSPATATIPANTPYYFLDGAQGSAFTITMPASAVEGQIQRVVCEAATVGTLTVAANSGQTLKGNPNAACVAGVGYSWRYQASNTTWYRFQ